MPQKRHRSDSFVLRIWWEQGKKEALWRGWIQHAASGRTQYFNRPADLLAFIESHTGSLKSPPNLKPKQTGKKGEIK